MTAGRAALAAEVDHLQVAQVPLRRREDLLQIALGPNHAGDVRQAPAGGQPVDMTGNVLDRDKVTAMLKEYYQLRGWDEKTGLPTKETLTKLGMEDMAVET